MADVALIRKRLRSEIDQARRTAAERRERAKGATRAYEAFLESIAIPAFRQVANALRAEGIAFEVQTPSAGVRLVPDRGRDDGVELELDTSHDPPQVMLASTHTWGSRIRRNERSLSSGTTIDRITEDDLLEQLVAELRPWLG
jgi:sirohydrochlorin ferrochelatase